MRLIKIILFHRWPYLLTSQSLNCEQCWKKKYIYIKNFALHWYITLILYRNYMFQKLSSQHVVYVSDMFLAVECVFIHTNGYL